jgi:hypothetical protein
VVAAKLQRSEGAAVLQFEGVEMIQEMWFDFWGPAFAPPMALTCWTLSVAGAIMVFVVAIATSVFVLVNAWFTFKRWRQARLEGEALKDGR